MPVNNASYIEIPDCFCSLIIISVSCKVECSVLFVACTCRRKSSSIACRTRWVWPNCMPCHGCGLVPAGWDGMGVVKLHAVPRVQLCA